MATKRLVKSKSGYKLWIFAAVITLSSLLGFLETQGIQTAYTGDMSCGGSIVCEGYFNISVPSKVSNYLGISTNITSLCFGKDLKVQISDPELVENLQIWKADKRYRSDNPARWRQFDFSGNCLPIGDYEFRITATKLPWVDVKWGIFGTNIDPWWNASVVKKIQVTVTNNAGTALTNFPLIINSSSNLSTGFSTWNLINSNTMQSDCDDLWIVNSTENGYLKHKIENGTCNTNNTIIMVNVNLSIGENTLYIYYNASGETNHEDKRAVLSKLEGDYVWYDFDEGSGTKTIDSGIRSNNGTLGNSSSFNFTGRGYALGLFNNANDYVNLTTNLTNGTQVFTIEFWINPGLNSPDATVWTDQLSTGVRNMVFANLTANGTAGYHFLYANSTAGDWEFSKGIPLSINSWSHVVIVKNLTNMTIYVNGSTFTSELHGINMAIQASSFMFGAYPGASNRYWNGSIDGFNMRMGYAMDSATAKARYDGISWVFGNIENPPITVGGNLSNFTSFTIDGTTANKTYELGSNLNIYADLNGTNSNNTVCIDLDYPWYGGKNYYCSSDPLNYSFNAIAFVNKFTNGNFSNNYSYVGTQNSTFNITINKKAIIYNASFNILGYLSTAYPSGIKIDIFNDSIIDYTISGNLTLDSIVQTQTNTSSANVQLYSPDSTANVTYISISGTNVTSATINLFPYQSLNKIPIDVSRVVDIAKIATCNGRQYVVYRNNATKYLYFTNNSGNSFYDGELINTNFTIGEFDFKMNSTCNPIVVYRIANGINVVARNNTGVWNMEKLFTNSSGTFNDSFHYESLAFTLDSNNKKHICFGFAASWLTNYIIYMTDIGGTWSTEEVIPSDGSSVPYCDITVDSSNNPFILYHRSNTANSILTNKTSGTWYAQTIELFISVVSYPRLYMNLTTNTLHMSYIKNNVLYYRNRTTNGTIWGRNVITSIPSSYSIGDIYQYLDTVYMGATLSNTMFFFKFNTTSMSNDNSTNSTLSSVNISSSSFTSMNNLPQAIFTANNLYMTNYSYPIDFAVDVGGDTTNDYTSSTLGSPTVGTDINKTAFNYYIQNNCAGLTSCNVPIYFSSDYGHKFNLTNISITVKLGSLPINLTLLQNATLNSTLSGNNAQIPIRIEATTGIVEVGNISVFIQGSANYTIRATFSGNATHNITNTSVVNISVYYSNYAYRMPTGISYLEFIPSTSRSKNVSAFGQTSIKPILNFTYLNYGQNMNLSIRALYPITNCESKQNWSIDMEEWFPSYLYINNSRYYEGTGSLQVFTSDTLTDQNYVKIQYALPSIYLPRLRFYYYADSSKIEGFEVGIRDGLNAAGVGGTNQTCLGNYLDRIPIKNNTWDFVDLIINSTYADNCPNLGGGNHANISSINYIDFWIYSKSSTIVTNVSFYIDQIDTYVNSTLNCVQIKANTTSTIPPNGYLNETWQSLSGWTNQAWGYNTSLWLWADYNCSGSYLSLYQPRIETRGCCLTCRCGSDY